MKELFAVPPPVDVFERCDCRTRQKNGKKIKLRDSEQPLVRLVNSVDPRWLVGRCKCGKVLTQINKEER